MININKPSKGHKITIFYRLNIRETYYKVLVPMAWPLLTPTPNDKSMTKYGQHMD